MATAGDPRRGQRGDTQRSRQKLVTDLRRRQRIRPEQLDVFAWYRADRLDLTDGDLVTEWRDQSGNGRHATLASDDPNPPIYTEDAINGRAAVWFGNDHSNLLRADFDTVEQLTDILVMTVLRVEMVEQTVTVVTEAKLDNGDRLIYLLSEGDAFWELATFDGDYFGYFPEPGVQPGDRLVEGKRTADQLELVVDDDLRVRDSHGMGPMDVNNLEIGGNWSDNDVAYLGEQLVLVGDQINDRDDWHADLTQRWGL